jgi:hypothetical protein
VNEPWIHGSGFFSVQHLHKNVSKDTDSIYVQYFTVINVHTVLCTEVE